MTQVCSVSLSVSWSIAQFVVASTDRLEMYGFNQWELIWNICRTIFVLLGLYLALLFSLSPVNTILLYSLIMTFMYAICYILNILAIKQVMKRNDGAGNSPERKPYYKDLKIP